jgi:ABC-type Fe3+-siderophore transport system permease subunit
MLAELFYELTSIKFIAFLNTHIFMIAILAPWFERNNVDYTLWTIENDSFADSDHKVKWNTIRATVILALIASILVYIGAGFDANNNNSLFSMVILGMTIVSVIMALTAFTLYHVNKDDMFLGSFSDDDMKWMLFGPTFTLIGFLLNFVICIYLSWKFSKRRN